MSKGRLIVIEGPDGSGKTVQANLLAKRLQKAGYKIRNESFPQYGKRSAGPVEDYLNGIYGSALELGPKIPSIFYAIDRFAAKKRIEKHLKEGFVILVNRYVTSNLAHQGGKLKSRKQRQEFYFWAHELEYNFFKIPKPDLQVILHVPASMSIKLVKQKGPRFYIGHRSLDIHEKDTKHIQAAERTYLELAKKFKYPVIEETVNGKLLDPQTINDQLYKIVKRIL